MPHTVPCITTAITWVVLHVVQIIRRLDTYLPTATHLGIFTHFWREQKVWHSFTR